MFESTNVQDVAIRMAEVRTPVTERYRVMNSAHGPS